MIRLEHERLRPAAHRTPNGAAAAGSFATALVSGRAIDSNAGFDAGFALPHSAGRAELLAWIESTNARDVFVTGAASESIAAALGGRARAIGPPQQMTLFPHKAAP
jgi:hypothetical protein